MCEFGAVHLEAGAPKLYQPSENCGRMLELLYGLATQ